MRVKVQKKKEVISWLTEDIRKQISDYVWYYNPKRLHSSISDITPFEKLIGKDENIIETREQKLGKAR